jgi:biotin carboxyl carrier protein
MRKFSITVNGQAYDVEVEEIGGAPVFAPAPVAAPVAAPAPVAAASAPKAAAPAAPKAAAPAPAGGEAVKSPMPGTILDVKVAAGQSVKKGTVLVILEAMKMENEILAPRDAVVAAIPVSKGSSVNAGDTIVTLG